MSSSLPRFENFKQSLTSRHPAPALLALVAQALKEQPDVSPEEVEEAEMEAQAAQVAAVKVRKHRWGTDGAQI